MSTEVTFLPGRVMRRRQEEVREEEWATYDVTRASSRANFDRSGTS
jgi:hypothetical protein